MTTLLLVAMFLVAKPQAAEVVRVAPTASRITFDPKDPGPRVPKLSAGENAICETRFDAQIALQHEVVSRDSPRDSQSQVVVRVRDPRITLSMNNTIYLPTDVRGPLRTHEEGHRLISERVYATEAEAIAREAADHVIAREWTAPTVEQAIALAVDEFRAQYRRALAKRIAEVNVRFDDITRHGKNADIAVVDAIDQAFEQPTTRATTP